MKAIKTVVSLSLLFFILSACTSKQEVHYTQTKTTNNQVKAKTNKSFHSNKSSNKGVQIAGLARSFIGTPYRYGGSSPNGFDCSGLVYYTHNKLGIPVPRTSKSQFTYAKPIQAHKLNIGDVVFFKLDHKSISHIGIYLGQGNFVHAPKSGKKVSISHLNESFWKSRFAGGGRLY